MVKGPKNRPNLIGHFQPQLGANYVRFHADNVQHHDFPFMKAFLMPGVTQKETCKFVISVLLLGY